MNAHAISPHAAPSTEAEFLLTRLSEIIAASGAPVRKVKTRLRGRCPAFLVHPRQGEPGEVLGTPGALIAYVREVEGREPLAEDIERFLVWRSFFVPMADVVTCDGCGAMAPRWAPYACCFAQPDAARAS